MVMIVKDHEKQAHGFISVTRVPGTPADLRRVFPPRVADGRQPAVMAQARWLRPYAGARKARTLALGAHRSEQ